jgi:hypothetical protein
MDERTQIIEAKAQDHLSVLLSIDWTAFWQRLSAWIIMVAIPVFWVYSPTSIFRCAKK